MANTGDGYHMRTILTILVCATAAPEICAQQLPTRAPSCEVGPPACAGRQSCCPPTCQPPENPTPKEGPPENPVIPRETGNYVAPPRSGVARGATNFRGFDFGTITFPEIRLRMPSIEFPHCFHARSNAHMRVESTVAPWESHGFVNAAAPVAGAAAEERSGPEGARDRAAAERTACEEYTQKLKAYEDELRRLEDERSRLEDCIRKCLDSNRGPSGNLPRAEMDCMRGDRSSVDRAGQRPTPVQLPKPLPDDGARRVPGPPPYYHEQPASYIPDPSLRNAPPTMIGELAPTARIMGLRPLVR